MVSREVEGLLERCTAKYSTVSTVKPFVYLNQCVSHVP